MKNTKSLIVLCLILFSTAMGCSDYMELAEKEYQAEREAMKENYKNEGFLMFSDKDETRDMDPYKDNPVINEEVFDKKTSDENEQEPSTLGEKEGFDITKQDQEEPAKESEKSQERRKSYWDRIREREQNN